MTRNYYRRILKVLDELKTLHPSFSLGKHLSTALDEHDLWGIEDKEFLNALLEYKDKFELDLNRRIDEDDISKIIKDGMHLNRLLLEDDEDE